MPAHWEAGDTDWDTLTLGGFKLPGVPRVTVKRGRKLDKKSAKGRNGATITDGGGQGAEVEIELRIATAEDWDTWCLVLWALDPTKVAPQAYTVVHPQTEAFQVQSVMIEDISAGPPDSGIYTVKIKCAEWFAAPKAGAKNKTTTPTTASGPMNVLDMARDRANAKRAAAYDAATGGLAGPPPPSFSGNNLGR